MTARQANDVKLAKPTNANDEVFAPQLRLAA
jgi:hypothetical protein